MKTLSGIHWIMVLLLGTSLALAGFFFWPFTPVASVTLPDGSLLRVEAVTYGTNHVVGPDTSWRIQLWKRTRNFGAWFSPVARLLLPTKGQSRLKTRDDSVVLWVNWINQSNTLYLSAGEVLPVLRDEHGCGFHPSATGNYDFSMHGLRNGFNRVAFVFESVPVRQKAFNAEFSLRRGNRIPVGGWSNQIQRLQVHNPRFRKPAEWRATALPATQFVQEVEFVMNSLGVHTNNRGDGITYWGLAAGGRTTPLLNSPAEWDRPKWTYEDSAGNRGPEFCQYEPAIKCTATAYPSPKAELQKTQRAQLPLSPTPSTAYGIVWQTNIHCGDASFRVVGLWGPGTYVYQDGWLTNGQPPQAKEGWHSSGRSTAGGPTVWTHTLTDTNHMILVQKLKLRDRQRLHLRVKDDHDRLLFTSAYSPALPSSHMGNFLARPEAPGRLAADLTRSSIMALEADSTMIPVHLPTGAEKIALEFSVQNPRRAEFYVRPPFPQ